MIKADILEGDKYQVQDEHTWTGQEVGVNSNVPLVDEASGPVRIVREFKFNLNPDLIKKIKRGEVPNPTNQELFNAHHRQLEMEIWKDGLVFDLDHEPRMTRGKKGYRIILACKPRVGVMVREKPQTLQEITKPSP